MPPIADTDSLAAITPPGQSFTRTKTGFSTREPRETHREGWQKSIDQLLFWWSNPEYLADEDFDAPDKIVLDLAMRISREFGDSGYPAPDSVVPDANGGIVFERRERDITEVFHIWSDGDAEYLIFHGPRLIERGPL